MLVRVLIVYKMKHQCPDRVRPSLSVYGLSCCGLSHTRCTNWPLVGSVLAD